MPLTHEAIAAQSEQVFAVHTLLEYPHERLAEEKIRTVNAVPVVDNP
jgi:hypothetical protein